MRNLVLFLVVCAFSFAAADNMPFTGTWRIDLNKMQAPKKPMQFEIGKGMYRCLTCDPKVEVKADGQDHSITGNPNFDTMNVKIVNDNVIEETDRKGNKLVGKSTVTVSAEGNHAVFEFTNYPPNSSDPVTGKAEVKRVGSKKPGMHAASGSWTMDKFDNLSENGKEFTYEQSAEGLNAKDPTGFSYSAKFDGKDYPVSGTDSIDSVVVKRINDHTLEEIDKYKGKVKNTSRMTVSADGKTMTVQWRDSNGFSGKGIAEKK